MHVENDKALSPLAGGGAGKIPRILVADADEGPDRRWERVRTRLRRQLSEEVYGSWFARVELVSVEAGTAVLSVPTLFLKNWIHSHYADKLMECLVAEIPVVERIELMVRQPGRAVRQSETESRPVASGETQRRPQLRQGYGEQHPNSAESASATDAGGFQGSPIDRKLNFDNFVVGASNRLAQAAAKQVAETVFDQPLRFNPLCIHSAVGLGKSHLLHAIAWEVKRLNPSAQVLYFTAERWRYKFVEALRRDTTVPFKERMRGIDILLLDDLEFLKGDATEQEFDHTINALIDSGKQIVVASSRPPMQHETMDQRMKSRLSCGLVVEISPLDYDLRLKILERRLAEKQGNDPSFHIAREVLEFLAERLTESGRELDGAITRLHATCHFGGTPITVETAEHTIRDLMRGMEPKRIKVEDILRVVSKHFCVSKHDILSQRRHRSIVWPRQVGMYLAKAMTARSLPEIGRRFGNRDHTTVLHAIRKIEGELKASSRLRAEIEDLKKMLAI
jgi:chromosomal replication initiator protein